MKQQYQKVRVIMSDNEPSKVESIADNRQENQQQLLSENSYEETAKDPCEEAGEQLNEQQEDLGVATSEIATELKEIRAQLGTLSQLFDKRIKRTTFDEITLKNYSDEIQECRNDLYKQITLPLLKHLISLRDSILTTVNNAKEESQEAESAEVKAEVVKAFADNVEDILFDWSVAILNAKPGQPFDSVTQRIIEKVKTTDESLHGTIAEVCSSAYVLNDKCIEKARVKVHVFDERV